MSEAALSRYRRRTIASQHELRSAIVDVTGLARRTLSILTPDLEPALYDHDDFIEAVKCFVLSRSFARVRVLIADPARTIRTGHRFVSIGRRLSSYIEFRNLRRELRDGREAYLIADDVALVHRSDAARWVGLCEVHAPDVAAMRLERFEALWKACELRTDSPPLQV